MTLIEVMVAVAIAATVTTIIWTSFTRTLNAKRVVEESEQRYQNVRVAMERMSRELSMAYISLNEDLSAINRRTFFVAQRHGELDSLEFTAFAHVRLRADANESDQCAILYYGRRDADEPRKLNLMRRETRRLANLKSEDAPGSSYVLAEDVIRLSFLFFDWRDNEWRDTWDTTAADGQPNRLPSMIRIALTIRDENGREITFTTATRILLQEALDLMPRT